MARKPGTALLQIGDTFEPADYSLQELAFLMAHMEETPTVALFEDVPAGVNRAQIERTLTTFNQLEELRKVKKQQWAGFDAIKDSAARFIAWQEKTMELRRRGGPRHPSMHTWDSTGAMTTGGIGSDSSEKVRHEITDDNQRIPFAVPLRDVNKKSVDLPWVTKTRSSRKSAPVDIVSHTPGIYTCSICDKPVATYDTITGRRGQNKARTAAVKHLKTCKSEITRHRAILGVPIE